MKSPTPDPDALDDAWEGEGSEEDPDSTRMVDSRELFERAGIDVGERGGTGGGAEGERHPSDGRITLPPPGSENEYVAKVAETRTRSSKEFPAVPSDAVPWGAPRVADDFEGTLGALLQEQEADPAPPGLAMHLDCDEPGVPSAPSDALGLFGDAEPDVPTYPPGGPTPFAAPGAPRFGLLDQIDSPHPSPAKPPRPAAPRAVGKRPREPIAPSASNRARPAAEDAPHIDFRLDLGFEAPEPARDVEEDAAHLGFPMGPDKGDVYATSSTEVNLVGVSEEPPPLTPPPGTLRFGLVEDDADAAGNAQRDPFVAEDDGEMPPPAVLDASYHGASHTIPSPGLEAAPSSGGRREKMRQRFEAGDYSGALVLAEAVLEEDPNDPSARRYAESCTELLRQMYRARVGDGADVLRVILSNEDLRSLNLDHRAGFLLSCVDGFSSIDEILDVSGMPELEALRILFELVQAGVVA